MANADIGIDLGTSNIVMTMGKRGVILNEPSVIAYNTYTERVLAVGKEAYKMIGRNPDYISVVHPISEGVISDDDLARSMIREFILKVAGYQLIKPRIIICIPSYITDVESRAAVDAARSAGARQVYMIQEPISAAIGAGIDIAGAKGNLVVDIGGGTTNVAIVSMNGVVASHTIKIAGNCIDNAIIKYIQNKYKILIGERTAEYIKIHLANLYDPNVEISIPVKGRSLLRGLPEIINLNEAELYEAIEDEILAILEAIRKVLGDTPPELVSDIHANGIILTGGGALLGGLCPLVKRTLGVECRVADDPMNCVAKGTCVAFKEVDTLLDGFENAPVYKYR